MIIVNVDGADGTGKTTLVNGLVDYYTSIGKKITFLHFPRYNTELGKIIKKVLLKEINMNSSSFQMLCSADRLDWSIEEYPKMKEKYDILIVDRYSSSAIVYGQIEGLEPEEILFNDRKIAQPNVQIILLGDAEMSLNRMNNRNEASTKYENYDSITKATSYFEELKFHIPNVKFINAKEKVEDVKSQAIKFINECMEGII